MSELNWTEAQWQAINDAVADAFAKASVATAFLNPCYGPLPGGVETVRNERLLQVDDKATLRLEVDHDALNLRLVTLRVNVSLSSEQVADETLSNALLTFRRAANILAQEEDRIVFDGHERGGKMPQTRFVSNEPRPQKGLADPLARPTFESIAGDGSSVVPAVVNAISKLEDKSNPGPFVCILGNNLFAAVHTPNSNSLVLPADRITPIVKGPLLRAGKMDENTGIVVSLGAKAVDLVVGTPPTVQFLQRTEAGRFIFRVYERFVLRLRDSKNPPVEGFTVFNEQLVAAARAGVTIVERPITKISADAAEHESDISESAFRAADLYLKTLQRSTAPVPGAARAAPADDELKRAKVKRVETATEWVKAAGKELDAAKLEAAALAPGAVPPPDTPRLIAARAAKAKAQEAKDEAEAAKNANP